MVTDHVGLTDTVILTCMPELSATLMNDTRWEPSENMDSDVLRLRHEIPREEHVHTLISSLYLAPVRRSMARCKEAERLRLQILEEMKALGAARFESA